MATQTQVKNYLAYWFQLGKKVVTEKTSATYQPETVIEGDHFSPEFEDCWRNILKALAQEQYTEHYLEGTDQTIEELLSPSWEIVNCARCDMLVPTPEVTFEQVPCPCNDLPTWPNEELPKPRLPINNREKLSQMSQRISANLDAEQTQVS